MNRSRTKPLIAACLIVGCGLVAACGDRDAPEEPALQVVVPREPEELDPRFIGDPYGLRVSRLIYASLVQIDPRTLDVVPELAERIETESPVRVRVTLRPGLRFSDGSTLDADDVIATFESVVDPDLGSRYAGTYRRIQTMERVDDRTVVFVLDAPHATFVTDLELPVMRAEDAARHVGLPGDPAPVGAGPYVLESRSSRSLLLTPNPHWHRGRPDFPRVRLSVIRDDNTRALRMLAGKADLAVASVPPLLVPMFEEDERFEVESAPGIGTFYVGLHTGSSLFDDVRVRRALAHAIDRRLLVDAKLNGRGLLARGWIPPGHWAYTDDVADYGFDPDRARALLDEAGLVDPDGEGPRPRAQLGLRTSTDRFRLSVAHAIAAMLRDVGLDVEVRPSDAASLIVDLNRGRFEMCILEVPEVFEPHVLSWFFGSDRIPGGGNEGANRWRYANPELDQALEAGRATLERDERIPPYHEVQRILARDLPVVPLWHADVVAIMGRRARGFDVPRDGRLGTLAR